MRVAFEALIKEINHKSLVSGDKATWIKLEFDSDGKIRELNALNKLQKGDEMVYAVLMDKKEAIKETGK